MNANNLPVAVIGAGPIGLAAAAHLVERGIPVRSTRRARRSAPTSATGPMSASLRPGSRASTRPRAACWKRPAGRCPTPTRLPTGEDLYRHYLKPLSRLPAHRAACPRERPGRTHHATGARQDVEQGPRRQALRAAHRARRRRISEPMLARAVIDASGTWQNPNPLGRFGPGGRRRAPAFQDHIAYGMPDVLGAQRARYADKRIAVVGAGYSAINVLLDLAQLCKNAAKTKVTWIVRGKNMSQHLWRRRERPAAGARQARPPV